jgi:hypothetical protein
MRLPSLSKWKSEMPGQSRHTLPDSYRRLVPQPDPCSAAKGGRAWHHLAGDGERPIRYSSTSRSCLSAWRAK